MTTEEKLDALGMAWIRAFQAIDKLADRLDDADVTAAERTMIALRMPTLRADRDALQARLVALAANATVLAHVPDAVFADLQGATAKLQAETTGKAVISSLTALATDLLKIARSASG